MLRQTSSRRHLFARFSKNYKRYKYIYLMALPVVVYYVIFMYWPMYGAQIAFKRFSLSLGIERSPWIGLTNFSRFFGSFYFNRVLRNTLLISIYNLIFTFPAPILLALLLNELRSQRYKRIVQTTTYLPHFISIMVVCGMIIDFTRSGGVINDLLALWIPRQTMLTQPSMFRRVYIISEIWQSAGWGSIIYLSALTSIDPELYEAAVIDGAGRFQKVLNITLPGIAPTIVVMFILRIGQMMNVSYEKIILLYNETTYEVADVISTFVYRKGLVDADYSYSSAVGLFNSGVNLLLLVFANTMSRKVSDMSLW